MVGFESARGLERANPLVVDALGVPNLDAEPLRDLRVRRALHMAVNLKDVIQVNPFGYGHGASNPVVPAALREWSIPIDPFSRRVLSSRTL